MAARPAAKLKRDKPAWWKTSWLRQGTGKRITTLKTSSLRPAASAVESKSESDFLCSYSWARHAQPVIYVPGAPRKWTTQEFPKEIPKDRGTYYIDQNAAKCPNSPYDPLFSALRLMRPSFSFDSVDLLANRSSLRALLSFANGNAPRSFRIDCSLMGNTLVMARRERNAKQKIRKTSETDEWGHGFETAFTTPAPGLEDTNGHHRAIQYKLGHLNCVVTYEADAWYDGEPLDEGEADDDEAAIDEAAKDDDDADAIDEDAADAATNDSINEPPADETPQPTFRIRTRTPISPTSLTTLPLTPPFPPPPTSQIAELKTATPRNSFSRTLHDSMAQLYFGRTRLLIVGRHREGVFQGAKVRRVAFSEWEEKRQGGLRRLVTLVGRLRRMVGGARGGRAVVVGEKGKEGGWRGGGVEVWGVR